MVKGVVEEGGTDYNVLIWIIMFQVTWYTATLVENLNVCTEANYVKLLAYEIMPMFSRFIWYGSMFVNKHKFVVVHFNIKIESAMYSEGQYGESIRRRVKRLVWSAGCFATTMIYYGLQIIYRKTSARISTSSPCTMYYMGRNVVSIRYCTPSIGV